MISVYTYMNALTQEAGKNKYCFRSVADQTLDSEQLINEIISYNSTITEADARAVLSVLNDRVKHFVNLGYKVELPFGYVYNKANGTVSKLNDGFVPGTGNHRITAVFKFKDDAAEEMVKNAAYKLAGTGFVGLPVIKELCSKQRDGNESDVLEFAPGAILKIKGANISFDSSDGVQGVFFVASDKSETRADTYNHVGTSMAEAYIPAGLAAGSYKVKLVTKAKSERYEEHTYTSAITVAA